METMFFRIVTDAGERYYLKCTPAMGRIIKVTISPIPASFEVYTITEEEYNKNEDKRILDN